MIFFWHNQRMGLLLKARKINGFCAFCKSPRWFYKRRSLGAFHIIMSLIASAIISIYAFGNLDPKLTLFFVVGLCISEVFTQIRWRMSLVCKQCGFDPVIYKRDTVLAAKMVKKHLEQRQNTASLLLKPLHLPTLSPERAEVLQKLENQPRLSKQI